MSDDVQKPIETNKTSPQMMFQSSLSSNFPSTFQIFFLSQDQNQSVEVVETEEIDFWELIGRLNVGESVFIKNKTPRLLETRSKMNNKNEAKFGYFTRY
jgi:hypothetical protein